MKIVISLILCVVMMGLCILPVVAAPGDDIMTDLVLGGLGYIITEEGEKILLSEAVSRKGDVNFDGQDTADDARLCLQAVASPDLSISSILSNRSNADVNNDGKITAVDARIMLQDVAGMTVITTYAQAEKGGSFVVGPLRATEGTPYYWQCEVDKSGLNFFDRLFDNSPTEVIGGVLNQYFVFTPENVGTYTIKFKLADANQTEVIDEFNCVLTVTEV